MSEQIKDGKLLEQAVSAAKYSSRELEDKEFKKYWSEISVPLTFQDGLSNYTKSELDDIRKHLKVKNASNLKKADLINVLAQHIPNHFEQLFLYWDEERFTLLTNIAKNGGHMAAPHMEISQIDYFRLNGLIFTGTNKGQQIVAIPTEMIEPILSLKEEVKAREAINRNTELIKLTRGLLYYYGTLTPAQLIILISKYSNLSISNEEYLDIIIDMNNYLPEIQFNEDSLSNSRVLIGDKVYQAHKVKKDVPFYPFDKQQLLLAGESNFIDRNNYYHDLTNFLIETFNVTEEEADSVTRECIFAIRNDQGLNDIMTLLSYMFELNNMPIVRALTDIVLDLMNNTRKWTLKGYTSKELKQATSTKGNHLVPRQVEKIGRNEPCPCGSGKKYKKCCGKSA